MLPPLSDQIQTFCEFENILTAEDPLGQTSEKGYLDIFTLKMRVIYDSDIFEKLRHCLKFFCFLIIMPPIIDNICH